jgi:ATP-dependent Lon protease
MPKRSSKENVRRRKASEDMIDDGDDVKNSRYNLRNRKKDKTIWVNDDTLDDDEDSQTTTDEEDEEDAPIIRILFSKNSLVDDDEEPPPKRRKENPLPIQLSRREKTYYDKLDARRKDDVTSVMKRISNILIDEGEVPFKFRVMALPISDYTKALVIKKLEALSELHDDTNGAYKLRSWVDSFLRIPFGKTIPLPIRFEDGLEKCTEFMVNARNEMDKHIYGMGGAKTQIMQMISQWIVNPKAVGNVIALHGPAGIGKTTFAKSAIASTLRRPFSFFTLGGASDIANFVGHSYTYEGSTWGRITDSIMQCGVMNPIMYFDELDKISNTPHGEEIVSMLIHLTDRSQNKEFHDRYFAGIDFDLSQCLFVFSLNDLSAIHPILRDRMTIIECAGYNEGDKIQILKHHIWPELLERMRFTDKDIIFETDVMRFLISETSSEEKGVRNLIRSAETLLTRLNMLRVSKHQSMKEYEFYMDVEFPFVLTQTKIEKLLSKSKKKEFEPWMSFYT